MPIYEYECSHCGQIREAFQKISDEPLKTCEHCSGNLRKLISHNSFHLKGAGWYVTDYKNTSSPSSPTPSAADGTESKTTSRAKSDTHS